MLKSLPRFLFLVALFQGCVTQNGFASWLDRSPKIFLPPKLSAQLEAQQTFPIFWWNFLIFEYNNAETAWAQVTEICDALALQSGSMISKTGCSQNLNQFKPLIADWAQDQFLRHPSPTKNVLQKKLTTALTKASLPAGNTVLDLLRVDPLESYRELQENVEKRLSLKFKKKFGFFVDEETQRIVIPVQFTFAPFEIPKTAAFTASFQQKYGEQLTLIGPHASSLENERQVTQDLDVVSQTGTLLLVLLAFAVLITRRWKLLLIVPPVLLSTLASMILTVFLFGSIHGLTLAFGTGIIAIAIDFGLHSVFNRNYPGIWKANAFGLYTTTVALIVMMFSSIPLLRQIMVFSTLGITLGYLILYALDHWFPNAYDVKPFAIKTPKSVAPFSVSIVLVLASLVGSATLKLSLDISQFNFQSAKNLALTPWLFSHFDSLPPLIQVNSNDAKLSGLDFAHAQKAWADQEGIAYEGIGNYLPPESEQRRNLESWSALLCSNQKENFSDVQLKLFEPFFTKAPCANLETRSLNDDNQKLPAYLKDLSSVGTQKGWISMWLAQNDSQVEQIKTKFPGSLSLKELVSIFPETLFRELKWMVPISFLLTMLLLAFYYRRIYPALLSLIPFFSGFGLFALAALLFQYNTSFITVIGLVMVFGFSVDYGIFATDLAIGKRRSEEGVWSALSLSALIAALGFLPLIFCKHPVLLQLGQPLVFGTIGTYVGTVWGVPGCIKYIKRYS